jgi:hypothetical protein
MCPLTAALVLSASRGAMLALAVGGIATLALSHRVAVDWMALAPGPVAVAAACAFVDIRGPYPAIDPGRAGVVAAAVVVASIASAWTAHALTRVVRRRPRVVAVSLALVAALAVCALAARGPTVTSLLGDRSTYWAVAWGDATAHPVLGSGAGTFADRWRASGSEQGALDAHSLYLEVLAEVGPVGLALVLAALGMPLVAIVRGRRLPWVPAAGGAYVAFLVHAGLDWDWEMPVVACGGLWIGLALLVGARRSGP